MRPIHELEETCASRDEDLSAARGHRRFLAALGESPVCSRSIVGPLGFDETPLYWGRTASFGGAERGDEGWGVRGTFTTGCQPS